MEIAFAIGVGGIALMIGGGYLLSRLSEWNARRTSRKFWSGR